MHNLPCEIWILRDHNPRPELNSRQTAVIPLPLRRDVITTPLLPGGA